MNREVFMKLNPCVERAINGGRVSREDLIAQGKFLATRTFIFEQLSPREAEILKLRYGLKDGILYTQQQISVMSNVTTARIQQLEKSALSKLAKPENMELLIKYDDVSAQELFIKKKVKYFDYRKAIIEDIEKVMTEGEVLIWSNISIIDMYIPSPFRSSIKQKLISGGIKNIENLISYWKNNQNLKKFGLGEATYSAVIFAIGKLFEDGSIEVTPKELLDEYNKHKSLYLNYLQANNLSDKVIFPELLEESKEENNNDQQIKREKSRVILRAQNVFGADLSAVSIDVLKEGISLRAYNALRRAHIENIEQLINYYYHYNKSFTPIRWLGHFGEEEIIAAMASLNIPLKAEAFKLGVF